MTRFTGLNRYSVMIIAGEASGDLHGSQVVNALKKVCPGIKVFGIGGRRMKIAGAEILINAEELAVVGITEALANASRLLAALRRAKHWIIKRRPDLLLLIDFPDFNLKTAAFAKKFSIPVLYYISPQIWAWRSGRVRKIRKLVDRMAVILPFEEKFYNDNGVPAVFVGHPLLDDNPGPERQVPFVPDKPVIGLLPGSRQAEVVRLLAPMLEAAEKVSALMPGARFILSRAPSVAPKAISELAARCKGRVDLEINNGPVKRLFSRCNLLVAASGTVTLEAALHQVPMIIVYKVSPLSYMLGRLLINVRHIGLANLIAGRTITPEIIQHDVNGTNIAAHMLIYLKTPQRLEQARRELAKVRNALGKPGAAAHVAMMAMELLEQKSCC